MSTSKETIRFILDKLGNKPHFSARSMFGEYALYAEGKTVALVCDNLLYVKILPHSVELENKCEKDTPYPGAKLHYVIDEELLESLIRLPEILLGIAKSLPVKNKKVKIG